MAQAQEGTDNMNKLLKSRSFRMSFFISFLVCFLGVMNGFERAIVSTLVVAIGAAIGFSGAMTFRRWRGDFRK
jgi:hypothetical protein